jgi:IS5 family transposase
MKQTTFGSNGFELVTKRMVKYDFFGEINLVVCWKELTGLIQTFAPANKTGRPLFHIASMLRIHFLHQWFGLNDPAIEDALHDMALARRVSSAAP